jgi:hypothetical protein
MTYTERLEQVKNDPEKHVSSENIKMFLDIGVKVESQVVGKFGYVSGISDNGLVFIKPSKYSKIKYATTFQRGDPVELWICGNYVLLKNPKWVIDGMLRGNEDLE